MNNMNNKFNEKKTMKTQKERIDKGRQAFNDEIIRCSESDNIYEAILEWEFTCEVDCYSNECDYDIVNITENLIDAGRPDLAYKVNINFKGYGGSGSCICGKNNLIYVYYIQNKINKTVLPTGSDCIKKVFPDGQVFNDILLLDKIIKSSKRSVKKIREENKNLKTENKELKSKIDEFGRAVLNSPDNATKRHDIIRALLELKQMAKLPKMEFTVSDEIADFLNEDIKNPLMNTKIENKNENE